MRVRDLLTQPELNLRLAAGDSPRLEQPVTWCAPAEGIDPARFLTPSCLLLTTGMGLNIEDPRTWDAYVERLAAVPVSAIAFGVGPVHKRLPPMLTTACQAHGMPLIEVPESTPFVSVLRRVEETLEQERFAFLTQGWTVADAATRAAATAGDELTAVIAILTVLADSLHLRVGLSLHGQEVLSLGPEIAGRGKTLLRLPGQDRASLALTVRGHDPSRMLQPVLGPTASLLSLQISHALATALPTELRSPALSALLGGMTTTHPGAALPCPGTLVRLVSSEQQALLLAVLSLRLSRPDALLAERGGEIIALVPDVENVPDSGGSAPEDVVVTLCERMPSLAAVLSTTSPEEAELALEALLAADVVPGVSRAQSLAVGETLGEHLSPVLRRRSARVLEPLQGARQEALLSTLRVFLEEAGSPARASEALGIHRNTLLYRVGQIEGLTGLDLSRGQDRFLAQLALAAAPEDSARD